MSRHIVYSEPYPFDLQTQSTLSFKNIRFDHRFMSIGLLLDYIRSEQISIKRTRPNPVDTKKKSKYIESILLRFPLQPLYFDAALPKWLVIDGRKRLRWLLEFIVDSQKESPVSKTKRFQLTGLQFYPQYEGKTFDQLPVPLQRTLMETEIMCYVLASGIDYEVRLSIFERFQPFKRRSLELYREQIENIAPLLNRFIQPSFFKELIQSKTKRAEFEINDPNVLAVYQLVINALVVVKSGYEQYAAKSDIYLTQKIKVLQQSLRRNDLQIFEDAIHTAQGLFGNTAFSLPTNEPEKIYPALFDVWIWALVILNQYADTIKMLHIDTKKNLLTRYNQLLQDPEFIQAIVKTPFAKQSILYRFTAINQIIEQVKNLKDND